MTDEEVKTEGIGWVYDADGERHEANGLFDHKTNMVLINPDNEGEIFTHSHELDHYMTKNHPEIAKELHAVMDAKMNEQARRAISDGQTTPDEFHADMLGEVMSDPEALRSFASDLETQRAGFGERFLRSVIEFCEKVMSFAKSNRHSPGAEAYFNDYKAVKAAAMKALQEMRRRNGGGEQNTRTTENAPAVSGEAAAKDQTVAKGQPEERRHDLSSEKARNDSSHADPVLTVAKRLRGLEQEAKGASPERVSEIKEERNRLLDSISADDIKQAAREHAKAYRDLSDTFQ